MKIVFLSPTGQLGGAERVLLDLVAVLRSERPEWTLRIVGGSHGPLLEQARDLGVATEVIELPRSLARLGDTAAVRAGRARLAARMLMTGPALTAYVGRLRRTLRRERPDLVQSNGFKMHVLAPVARPKAPILWHVHDYVGTRPLMRRFLRPAASACAHAVTNSESVAKDLRALCGDRLPVTPIENGVDLERFSPDGPRLDLDTLADLAAPPDGTLRIGILGTLGHWKGHEVFLEALARLPQDLAVRGYIVGGPIYQTDASQCGFADLRRWAAGANLEGRVGLTGLVAEPAAALRALDIVVHASTRPEPFGLVIAEAMACGRALVASAAGGAAEITRDNVDALTHPPGDASALAAALTRLARDSDLRRRLGAAARATAERRFDRRRMGRQIAWLSERVAATA